MKEPIKLNETEASSGSKPGVMRYVLPISIALVVVVFVALLIIYR
ncbi:MAG: hypothetical protein ACRYG4_13885 [Janthinobacterium lividum]